MFVCPFCNKELKTKNSLVQHKRFCIENPDREFSKGNFGKMPAHTKSYYRDPFIYRGTKLDITKEQFERYSENNKKCEICGRTIEETVHWDSPHAAKRLCLDHEHETNRFRGVLCLRCNRQLGWYEKYREQVKNYLAKDLDNQNKNI